MLPENTGPDSGSPSRTPPDRGGNLAGGEGGAGSFEEVAGLAAPEANQGAANPGAGKETEDEDSDGEGPAGEARGTAGPEVLRDQESPRRFSRSHRITDAKFRAAVKEAEGNTTVIAKALGCSINNVQQRIARDPELRALFGGRNGGYLREPAGPDAPSGLAPFQRHPSDIPTDLKGPSLLEAVEDSDREQYRRALLAYGVSDKYIAKSRALDGMAKNAGRLMAVSLNMTHQNYMGQLHVLSDVADDVRERMKGRMGEDGKLIELGHEDYAMLAKVLLEMTKEMRAGTTLVMQSTEALIRMENAINGKGNPEGEGKKKPGWGVAKKVNPVKPDA